MNTNTPMTPITAESIGKLRRLAEAATPGKRAVERHTTIDKDFALVAFDDESYPTEICRFDYDDVWHEQVDRDAAFMAACDRDTVLALLDEIERLRALVKEACEIADWFDEGYARGADCTKRDRLREIAAQSSEPQ